MITLITMYEAHCDNCLESFDFFGEYVALPDKMSAKEEVGNSDWHTEKDKHYCDACHSLNDEDEIVINKDRKKNQEFETPIPILLLKGQRERIIYCLANVSCQDDEPKWHKQELREVKSYIKSFN